jgi:hypothetical protein
MPVIFSIPCIHVNIPSMHGPPLVPCLEIIGLSRSTD